MWPRGQEIDINSTENNMKKQYGKRIFDYLIIYLINYLYIYLFNYFITVLAFLIFIFNS